MGHKSGSKPLQTAPPQNPSQKRIIREDASFCASVAYVVRPRLCRARPLNGHTHAATGPRLVHPVAVVRGDHRHVGGHLLRGLRLQLEVVAAWEGCKRGCVQDFRQGFPCFRGTHPGWGGSGWEDSPMLVDNTSAH